MGTHTLDQFICGGTFSVDQLRRLGVLRWPEHEGHRKEKSEDQSNGSGNVAKPDFIPIHGPHGGFAVFGRDDDRGINDVLRSFFLGLQETVPELDRLRLLRVF